MKKFEGLIAAPFTPMDENGDVMPELIPGYLEFLQRNGVAGVFINGSTGEGVSLSQRERLETTEAWTLAAKGKAVKVISLVGGTSYKDSIDSAQHAFSAGVDAIAIMAPYYFKPPTAVELVEFCRLVAASVPELPVYFYHIPVLTGCYVPMYDFLMEASDKIPNLAGIKYTHEDFMDYLSCLHFEGGKFDLLWGRDENFLSALVLGARAAVGSTFNYAAPLYHEMIRSFDAWDLPHARQLQQMSIDMIRLLPKYGGIATGKAFMKYLGFDFGKFRIPVKNMSAEAYERFVSDVDALDMSALLSVK
ncbi:dihydrodipicolinate synthase family protein [Geofilum rubicundum]|uniref:N-acetylneuraminate lyase n=1 Tax=Geofilum rubicundum JCM 15548 TaxID=1236989 RepID=A0A0E9LUU1_9BACT|nr:dihydrodipicolinate synthase family protein [Geofilum rubicundum]GAO29014.1 N-acetylneuraminate lyase [Geofilum rubicundum JCM 15548]